MRSKRRGLNRTAAITRRWATRTLAVGLLGRMGEWAPGLEKTDEDLIFEARLWALAGEPEMAAVCREAAQS
jgi:hypothetical protein